MTTPRRPTRRFVGILILLAVLAVLAAPAAAATQTSVYFHNTFYYANGTPCNQNCRVEYISGPYNNYESPIATNKTPYGVTYEIWRSGSSVDGQGRPVIWPSTPTKGTPEDFGMSGTWYGTFIVNGTVVQSSYHLESDAELQDRLPDFNKDEPWSLDYKWSVVETSATPPAPATATVTVYIKNSQTGAAIANSNVAIDALVNGEYYPVANTTEPSGIFTINLQPTGGGQPNPDGYRLIATADGYNNPMPEINFTVTDSKKYIYCYLDPIAGGPENENNTFIDFYVRDLSANPVSGATVKFGKYTLITNSQGYTVFEVPKNIDYTYTVSKSGYGPVTGNANIGANDRYIINAVIGPSVTPTAPTAIPTDTQTGPTPTLTAPTGEPVSNLLEWFAAHFGMLLGGGVEIGKIFMWLCFTVPVGVYVGKEAKAGAAGFMAGAGIVTLFFVIIGWVPIWIVVLLALIIGLLYAKVFNNSDTGGGR